MAVDKQPKNLAALNIGSGQFSLAIGATSKAAAQLVGWTDFGNLSSFNLTSKGTTKEHIGSYNGIRRVDKTAVTETRVGYQVKSDESSAQNMRFALYGSPGSNITQTVRSAIAADALTTPLKGVWYDLLIGGVRIRELTVCAVVSSGPTLVEDVDYVVDYKLGRIRFITTPGTLTSITLTAPAIVATDPTSLKTITPGTTPIVRGMGRMVCYDDDGSLVFDHHDFYCEVYPQGDVAFDGSKESEITCNINILTPVGTYGSVN